MVGARRSSRPFQPRPCCDSVQRPLRSPGPTLPARPCAHCAAGGGLPPEVLRSQTLAVLSKHVCCQRGVVGVSLLSEGRLVVSLLLEGCFGAVPAARGAFGGVPAAGIAWAPAQQEQPVVQRAPRRARLLPAAGWGQQLTRSATKRHPSRCCAFFPPRPGFALRRPPRSASRRCGAPLLCPPAAPPPRWETGAVLALPRTLPTVLEVLGRRCALGAAPGSRLRGCSAA